MKADTKPCDAANCGRPARSKRAAFCDTHRQRFAKYGTTELPPRPTLTDRFWSHVRVGAPGECWPWTAAIDQSTGYGKLGGTGGRQGVTRNAHRVASEIQVGPIPDGLTIDHTCLNRACQNSAHFELVTQAENSRRAKRRWTHCNRGHEFTSENTYWRTEGRRVCRQCARDRKAAA